MKKLLCLFITVALAFNFSSAQYCGNSGFGICTPNVAITIPGLYPLWDSLPPFINGVNSSATIQFKNFNIVYFSGFTLTMTSLTIDTISNLPSGLCWATNKANNTYANQENGCINVVGTPCDTPGQYKLYIIVTADVGIGTNQVINADAANLHYFVRLDNIGELITPIDSMQTAANPLIPYGVPTVCLDPTQTACTGSTTTITPTVKGGTGPYTYAWSGTGDTLSCTNCLSPTVTITQNSTYTITVTDGSNNTATASIAITAAGSSGNNFNITAGATRFCLTGSASFHASPNSGYAYQWLHDTTVISGATDSVYTASNITTSGSYSCLITVTAFGCIATSNAISVTIDSLPTVTFSLADTSYCPASASVTLNQGTPTGGTYTVDGATATVFNPAIEAIGTHVIKYKYTTGGGCSDSAAETVVVKTCLGIEALSLENSIVVYPSPANDVLNIQSDFFAGNVAPVIYDIAGQAIHIPFTRQANKISFATQTLAPGAYFIKLTVNGQTVSKRFMKNQ